MKLIRMQLFFQDILLSDNSDDSDDEVVTDNDIKTMLKDHVKRRRLHQKFLRLSEEVCIDLKLPYSINCLGGV